MHASGGERKGTVPTTRLPGDEGSEVIVQTLADALPEFDVETAYSIRIAAPAAKVYDVARTLDLSSSPVVRILFALRGMPKSGVRVAGLEGVGFKVLRDEPGRGFVLGLIGRFWTLGGDLQDFDPREFGQFSSPGYAKGIWSFEASDAPGGTILTTTTRVRCMDAESRRRFRRYWFVIGPFSGLIRRVALRIVKKKAEAEV